MLSDKQMLYLANQFVNDYIEAEGQLFDLIANDLKGYNDDDINDDWYMGKVLKMGALISIANSVIKSMPSSSYNNAIKNSFFANLRKKYQDTVNIPKVDKTILRNVKTNALEAFRQGYLDVLNQAYSSVISGTSTYDIEIKKAITQLVDKGFTGATYVRKDGSIVNMSLEAVARRDILTTMHQNANDHSLNACKQLGTNYVEVSSHPNARPDHALWQGKLYMLEGSTSKYQNFYEATKYGSVDGLGGVNCKHRFYPYVLGDKRVFDTYDLKENEKLYKLEQQQRANERAIRKWKQKANAVDTLGQDNTFYKNKVREWQKRNSDFVKEHGLTRDYTREFII